MNTLNLEINDIHIWNGTDDQIMVSYEDTKTLLSFPSIDEAVNGLWLAGDKDEARQLNKAKEG